MAQVEECTERGGAPGARGGVALDQPHCHQMHELGSIDVMRLDQTPVASHCLRIKLYLSTLIATRLSEVGGALPLYDDAKAFFAPIEQQVDAILHRARHRLSWSCVS